MIDRSVIVNLAELARMKLSDEEMKKLEKELGGILDYVGDLQKVDTSHIPHDGAVGLLRNTWREDSLAAVPGDREAILNEAPVREGDYIAVKKVIEYER